MYEPVLPDPLTAEALPDPAKLVRAVSPAGVVDARSLSVVYAPVTVTHHHAPAPVLAVQNVPVRTPPTPAAQVTTARGPLPGRRFTLPELCFYLGIAVTGSSVAAVALSIVAGDPTFLLGAPAVVGAATLLGSAAAINRNER